jgi:hypothetical protein
VNGTELLEHAAGVANRRRSEYGAPVEVFEALAKRRSLIFGLEITASQVVIALLDVKLVRLSQDPWQLDSQIVLRPEDVHDDWRRQVLINEA